MRPDTTILVLGRTGVIGQYLVLELLAMGENFNVVTAEHHSREEIAEMDHTLCPFRYTTVPYETYLDILAPWEDWAKYQMLYARMFQRITDNTKFLSRPA